MDYQINFPHLGIELEHVIKNFNIGSFTIAIYGITMMIALLTGLFVATRRAKETGQNPEDYLDLFLVIVIFGFLGARAYYVAFTWDYYKNNPLQILNFRGGGIALYGGIIGGVLSLIIFCKIKKFNFLQMLDTVGLALPLSQMIGRWGNFFNREAFGGYTDGLFAMQLPVSAVREHEITAEMWEHLVTIGGVDFIQVHPTFLYEGMWNLGLFLILLLTRNRTRFYGEQFAKYLVGYGVGRFWIESLRTDQLIVPGINVPVSMIVAACSAAFGLIWIILGRRRAGKEDSK